jgi:formylmethanofuran dehydrogenase subunit E
MTIFNIGKNRYATGTSGKLATYVVQAKGKKAVGVRGRRPLLDKRFPKVKAPAAVIAAFKAAL